MVEGISTAKIFGFRTSSTKLHICKNCIIVLSVNILTGVARQLLGPHGTLPYVYIQTIELTHQLLSDKSKHCLKLLHWVKTYG